MSGTCSDEFPMLTAKREIDFELEIDKFERNHENDCTYFIVPSHLSKCFNYSN